MGENDDTTFWYGRVWRHVIIFLFVFFFKLPTYLPTWDDGRGPAVPGRRSREMRWIFGQMVWQEAGEKEEGNDGCY